MPTLAIDMIVPGIFATGLTSQTFLPGVPAGSTPFLDALTAFGKVARSDVQPTLTTVCHHINIDPQVVASSQAALCWLAEFGQAPPPWVAVAQPVHLGVGRAGLNISESRVNSVGHGGRLLEMLQPVAQEHGFTMHLGAQFHTVFLVAEQPVDVSLSNPGEITGTQLREAGVSGKGAVLIDRLRTDFEMALHEHSITLEPAVADQPMPNSVWLWGAVARSLR